MIRQFLATEATKYPSEYTSQRRQDLGLFTLIFTVEVCIVLDFQTEGDILTIEH